MNFFVRCVFIYFFLFNGAGKKNNRERTIHVGIIEDDLCTEPPLPQTSITSIKDI